MLEPNLQNIPKDFDIEMPEQCESKAVPGLPSLKSNFSVSLRHAFVPFQGLTRIILKMCNVFLDNSLKVFTVIKGCSALSQCANFFFTFHFHYNTMYELFNFKQQSFTVLIYYIGVQERLFWPQITHSWSCV